MAVGVVYVSVLVLLALTAIASGSQYHHTGQNVITCTKGDKDHRKEAAYGANKGLK